jgi:glycosyltransferase involved in cell wall biosynthesis
MANPPKVSVLMPVHNNEQYLQEAVESILAQTYPHFELIVIDDGSTDNTFAIAQRIAQQDNRIFLYQNDKKEGLPYTRNRLLSLAVGKYVANLDSDDVALPHRLGRQVEFLENNPDVDVCGSFVYKIYENKPPDFCNYFAVDNEALSFNFFFAKSILVNSSAMVRKKTLDKFNIQYDSRYFVAQDTKFWYDLVNAGAKFYTIPEALVHFRIHEKTGVSAQHKEAQVELLKAMITEHIAKKIPPLSLEEIGVFIDFCMQQYAGKASRLLHVLNTIVQYNHTHSLYQQTIFDAMIDKMFFEYLNQKGNLRLSLWFDYQKLRTKSKHITSWGDKVGFFRDCLLGRKSAYYG